MDNGSIVIVAFALYLSQAVQPEILGPHPVKFESKKYGVSFYYPAGWKVEVAKPRSEFPVGLFMKSPHENDTLIFRAETSSRPHTLVDLRLSPGAKVDFYQSIKGHPQWWDDPYSLEVAGTSTDASWRDHSDPSLIDGQKAIVRESLLDMSPAHKEENVHVIWVDFLNPAGACFRFIGGHELPESRKGKIFLADKVISAATSNSWQHQQRLLLRGILKTIRFMPERSKQ